jgi:hypothetical protein
MTPTTHPPAGSSNVKWNESWERFVKSHPEWTAGSSLSALRERELRRLDETGQVYLDYTGAGLYPASLVAEHGRLLETRVLGNPHSVNPAPLLFRISTNTCTGRGKFTYHFTRLYFFPAREKER